MIGKSLRRVLLVVLALGCFSVISFALNTHVPANRDFISYWASGQQLVNHADPYDTNSIGALERSAGYPHDIPLIMRNPPYSLFSVYPLGLLSLGKAATVWYFELLLALIVSVRLCRNIFLGLENRTSLLAYCLPSVFGCLLAGQTGCFLLLGTCLFLRYRERFPYLAGAALILCWFKPLLYLPFAIVLLLWAVSKRQYRLLTGMLATLLLCSGFATALDTGVWPHYLRMMLSSNVENQLVPSLGLLLRLVIHPAALWLQMVPTAAGCLWSLWYFKRHYQDWSWVEHGCVLLAVSVIVAPYAWFTDEVVFVPVILSGLSRTRNVTRSLWLFGTICAVTAVEIWFSCSIASFAYIWSPTAWLLWYFDTARPLAVSPMASEGFSRETGHSIRLG